MPLFPRLRSSLARCRRAATSRPGAALGLAAALTALVAAQWLFTRAALPRLLYEELAESLRNPYWLSQKTLYNQWSSNVGWYGLLTAVYYAVGFDIYLAKWVRFALHIASLLFLAALFVRWQGVARGTALLVTIGLSSTWLYSNTYQTSYGIDLQFVPILFFILVLARLDREAHGGGAFWFGFVLCIAALCYPTALFYLPACLLLAAYRLWTADELFRPKTLVWLAALFACGFYLPIGAALVYLKDPGILLDGLFRGGGAGLRFEPHVISAGIERVAADLFVAPTSYCFDLPHVEFGNWLSFVLFLATVGGAIVYLLTHRVSRTHADSYAAGFGVALLLLAWFLVVPSCIPNEPGIRRSTGMLVGYYGAFSCLVAALWNKAYASAAAQVQPVVGWALLALQLAANGLTLGQNLATYPQIAGRTNESWIMIAGSPRASIEYWFQDAKAGRPIEERQFKEKPRIALRFAAVRALQLWNGREPFPVYGVDPNTHKVRTVSVSLWENWEWPP